LRERVVRVPLQRHRSTLAPGLVLRDQELAAHVVQTAGERLGREAAEHDGVRRPEARAGEHRDRQLGNHPHVDPNRSPFRDSESLECVREADDLVLEVGERDRPALVFRLTLPVVGDLLAAASLDVAVDAVEADVQLPAQIPLRIGRLPLVELLEGLEPRDTLTAFALPELLEAALIDVRLHIGLRCELRRWRITPLLQEHRLDRGRPSFVRAHGVRS
jgi:hypothetical protein